MTDEKREHVKNVMDSIEKLDNKPVGNPIQYVIMYGDFENGHEIVGPFNHFDDAEAYSEYHLDGGDWDIILLQEPSDDVIPLLGDRA